MVEKTGATSVKPALQPPTQPLGRQKSALQGATIPAAAYVLVACLGLMAFAASVTGHLIADDWMVLARNMNVRLGDIPAWFVQVRHDWFRPVYEMLAAGSWRAFGANPLGYRVVTLGLYGATIVLAGVAAEKLAHDRRVGIVAATVFASMHFHAEPATWFSAANELLAAGFALVAFIAYIKYRHTGRSRFLVASLACYLLALGSKESAVGLPLVLAVYELADREKADGVMGRLAPVAPFLLVGTTFLVLRLSAGNPYPHVVTPALLVKNAGHYGTLELLAWPIDFDYTAFAPERGITDLLPPITILAATMAWLLLGVGWIATRAWRATPQFARILAVAVAWVLVALLPVLPIVAERTAFLSSVGIAWLVAVLAVGAWTAARGQRAAQTVIVAGLVLFIVSNAAALLYRAHWWSTAGSISHDTIEQLKHHLIDVPPDQPIALYGLPDHLRHAYVFRNAFPHAGQVLGHDAGVAAVLDTAARGSRPDAGPGASTITGVQPEPLVLYYEDGALLAR